MNFTDSEEAITVSSKTKKKNIRKRYKRDYRRRLVAPPAEDHILESDEDFLISVTKGDVLRRDSSWSMNQREDSVSLPYLNSPVVAVEKSNLQNDDESDY